MNALNIIFAGTPAFALPSLQALFDSGHNLQAVFTQPDRPAGRGRKLQASPVKMWAEEYDIPIFQPLNFKESASREALAQFRPDVLIVIAYGLILPSAVLTIPKWGCINVHASLLPRWRGASPIQQAILAGDAETGVTIMQMEAGLDTGPMLATARCPIQRETTEALHDKLAHLAVKPLLETLNDLGDGHLKPQIQDNHFATYAPKIAKEDARINWQLPATAIDCLIRAYYPWPIAYTFIENTMVRVHQAEPVSIAHNKQPGQVLSMNAQGLLVACQKDALLIQKIQFPGGKAMSVADWLHAHPPLTEAVFLGNNA